MRYLRETLEERLRSLDPTLSAGKASDLYPEVVKLIDISTGIEFEAFSKEVTRALESVYGAGWLLNPNISQDVMTQVLYGGVRSAETPQLLEESVWYDGSVCRFASCPSAEIPVGKTFYFSKNGGSDQGFEFISDSKKPETVRLNLSDDLSIEIDRTGRLLYPAHHFDNLFLEAEVSTELELPLNITKGRVYIVEPSLEVLEECRYLKISALSSLIIDKDKKIIQFGKQVGEVNVEIISGFVLSLSQGRLVNAWLKIENVSA